MTQEVERKLFYTWKTRAKHVVSSAERTSAPRQLRIFSGSSIENKKATLIKKIVALFSVIFLVILSENNIYYNFEQIQLTIKASLGERWLAWPVLWQTGDGFWS
jgi:hypothetical protein